MSDPNVDPLDSIDAMLKSTMDFLGAPASASCAASVGAPLVFEDLDILGPAVPSSTATSTEVPFDLADLDLGSPPPKIDLHNSLSLASTNPLAPPLAVNYDQLEVGAPTDTGAGVLASNDREMSALFEEESLVERTSPAPKPSVGGASTAAFGSTTVVDQDKAGPSYSQG